MFVAEWGPLVWGGKCKSCGIGSIAQEENVVCRSTISFCCFFFFSPYVFFFLPVCSPSSKSSSPCSILCTLGDLTEFQWGDRFPIIMQLRYFFHSLWDAEIVENRAGRDCPIPDSILQVFTTLTLIPPMMEISSPLQSIISASNCLYLSAKYSLAVRKTDYVLSHYMFCSNTKVIYDLLLPHLFVPLLPHLIFPTSSFPLLLYHLFF